MSKLANYLSSNGIVDLLGPKPGYLTIAGAAHYASVSQRTIKRWITRGLPVYQGVMRGKVLVRPSDIDLYLQRKAVKPEVDLDALVNEVMTGLSPKAGISPGTETSARPRAKWARATKKGTVPDSTGISHLNQGL